MHQGRTITGVSASQDAKGVAGRTTRRDRRGRGRCTGRLMGGSRLGGGGRLHLRRWLRRRGRLSNNRGALDVLGRDDRARARTGGNTRSS